MSRIRRWAAALALAIVTLGSIGAVAVTTSTAIGAQLTCTDNWVGPTASVAGSGPRLFGLGSAI